jgi:hypothetical protein
MSRLIERITRFAADYEEKQRMRRKDKTIVAFLAIKDEIRETLEAGYAVKTVWACLREEGKITTNYQAFAGHVRRYVKGEGQECSKDPPKEERKRQKGDRQAALGPDSGLSTDPKPAATGFVYNPHLRKEDLL